jgi:hypothetical protein
LRPHKKPKENNPNAGKAKYEPTVREKTALDRYAAHVAAAPEAPRIKVIDGTIKLDHPDKPLGYALLMEALGTVSGSFMLGLLSQLANAHSRRSQIDEGALNFMLSVIKGLKPKDQLETMLAAQMAAIHMATIARPLWGWQVTINSARDAAPIWPGRARTALRISSR